MGPAEKAAAKERQGARTDLVETFHEVKTPQKTRDKIGEQRKFVLWWDGQEKHKGAAAPGTNRGTTPSQTTDGVKAADFGLDRDTIHRWRSRLKTDDNFPRGCRCQTAILTHESVAARFRPRGAAAVLPFKVEKVPGHRRPIARRCQGEGQSPFRNLKK